METDDFSDVMSWLDDISGSSAAIPGPAEAATPVPVRAQSGSPSGNQVQVESLSAVTFSEVEVQEPAMEEGIY